MEKIAVIDTETNWYDQVMSLGAVTADSRTLEKLDWRYYILTPEVLSEGMYSDRLELAAPQARCSREKAMRDLKAWLRAQGVRKLFAYNARFDCHHLQELGAFQWYDIMKIAAYRQYNRAIPECAPCCSTGRLRRDYGVEPILGLLRREPAYRETHNALLDAGDELQIMKLLQQPLELYEQCAGIL